MSGKQIHLLVIVVSLIVIALLVGNLPAFLIILFSFFYPIAIASQKDWPLKEKEILISVSCLVTLFAFLSCNVVFAAIFVMIATTLLENRLGSIIPESEQINQEDLDSQNWEDESEPVWNV